ncbi:MAG: hypothetical protein IKW24_02760, partial [Clostridia bacterium]|nr:hypothetical protein [Clostridia bacterium]
MKKSIVWLLCAVMLIGALAGCVNAPDSGEQETTVTTQPEDLWINPELIDAAAELGLGQAEVVILSQNEYDIAPEENSSDPLEDAVFVRDDKLRVELGVELNNIYQPDFNLISTAVKNDVSAGTGEYHIVYQHMIEAARSLAPNGYLYNL